MSKHRNILYDIVAYASDSLDPKTDTKNIGLMDGRKTFQIENSVHNINTYKCKRLNKFSGLTVCS